MRVLHLLDTPNFAGTERHVLDLSRSLRIAGIESVLGCRSSGELLRKARHEGLAVVEIWNARSILLGITPSIRHCAKGQYDMLHAHNGRTMLIAAIASMVTGIPAVATQHFIEPHHVTYKGLKRLIATKAHNWVNRRLRHYIAISNAVRREMIDREGIPLEAITTVHNGITPCRSADSQELQTVREDLKIRDGEGVVVCVCRLEREKNVENLLKAFQLIQVEERGLHLIVVGDGNEGESLKQQAKTLSLRNVHFIGHTQGVNVYIQLGNVFVLPSSNEPFGLVILEAMSLGKAVIACNSAGPAEIINNNFDGVLVEPNDPQVMADALKRLLSDAGECHRIGRNASESYKQRFTADRMARETLQVYQAITRTEVVSLQSINSAGESPQAWGDDETTA